MTNPNCELWRNDPEASPSHPAECADCRALAAEMERLDRNLAGTTVEPAIPIAEQIAQILPVAPWEGAAHRAWMIVLAGAAGLLGLAATVFLFIGVAPIEAIFTIAGDALRGRMEAFEASRALASLLRHAPPLFHALIAVAFVLVNTALVVLLRRSPRGYDVRSR